MSRGHGAVWSYPYGYFLECLDAAMEQDGRERLARVTDLRAAQVSGNAWKSYIGMLERRFG